VGILGVNLIYAAYHAAGSVEEFLASAFEDLGLQRVEIDCLESKGPAFESWDRNQLHAFLVAGGYAEAVVFPANNQFVPPNELLYKQALVLAPGQFDNVSQLRANLVQDTLAQLPEEDVEESRGGLGLFCLSVGGPNGGRIEVPVKEIVEHVEALHKLGYGVMLFRAGELYTMSAYVNTKTWREVC
jgi:hypothetical protein